MNQLNRMKLWRISKSNILGTLFISSNISSISSFSSHHPPKYPSKQSFSVPLETSRAKPETIWGTLNELWNDPRPVTSLMKSDDRSNVGMQQNAETGKMESIPYCIISEEFEICENSARFQILLYPRGRFTGGAANDLPNDNDANNNNGNASTDRVLSGQAGAYLRYLPSKSGEEVDITWKLRLVDTRTSEALPVMTSGGLPRSDTTWSAGMCFCSELEAIESVGRATDWGSSSWLAHNVCDALGYIKAEGEITLYDAREGESIFAWPPATKGGIRAVRKAAKESAQLGYSREFRVGEVIIPTAIKDNDMLEKQLKDSFVYPGVDYRIMTMSDKDGNEIFSTDSISVADRESVKLALRPCGWNLQYQLWRKRGMKTDWPVEVEAGLLSSTALTRFNPGSALPRIISAFTRDWVAYTFAILLAVSPIPLTLIGRNAVSLYAIPSASMEPTFLKGDVLLVEKLPGTFGRTKRGDVILFNPPQSLKDIIAQSGSAISGNSLFVKRIVGLPGDKDIIMNPETLEVTINGSPAVGPQRNMCDDEPLKLIDRLLEKGKGKELEELSQDEAYVLGDCKVVSVDSRVFGVLPKDNIVGRPLVRTWPVDRISFGPF